MNKNNLSSLDFRISQNKHFIRASKLILNFIKEFLKLLVEKNNNIYLKMFVTKSSV